MPEGLGVELYRQASEAVLGRLITAVSLPDPDYVRGGLGQGDLAAGLVGYTVRAARRRGKLLLLETDAATVGIRFGMTGRLIVDDYAVIQELEHASKADNPAWDRFVLTFDDGGGLSVRDQRRLGNVELNPNEDALKIDMFALDAAALTQILGASTRPLKARLMDQSQVAGLGNLLTDEVLWRAGVDPRRPANGVDASERRRLLYHLRRVLPQLLARGGSHMGDLQDQRHRDGICPKDGTPLRRHTVGGRTTYACPEHQRPMP